MGIFVHLLPVQYSFLSFSTAGATAKQPVPTAVMILAATSHLVATAPTTSDEKSIFHSSYMQWFRLVLWSQVQPLMMMVITVPAVTRIVPRIVNIRSPPLIHDFWFMPMILLVALITGEDVGSFRRTCPLLWYSSLFQSFWLFWTSFSIIFSRTFLMSRSGTGADSLTRLSYIYI